MLLSVTEVLEDSQHALLTLLQPSRFQHGDMVSDMSTEFSSRLLEMVTKSKFQIFGLITETHGRLRDKISSTKLDSMVTLKSTKMDPPREQDGKVAKRLSQLLTIPQSQDSTPIIQTT